MRLSVVIPSRLAPMQPADPASPWFVERAIACVRGQTLLARPGWSVQIVIGVDPGMAAQGRGRLDGSITLAEAPSRQQAAALNAALDQVDGDVVALLEDDDLWATDQTLLSAGRDSLVDLGYRRRSVALNYDSLRLAGNVWLALGPDRRWYRFDERGQRSELHLVAEPSTDVCDLVDPPPPADR